MTPDSERSGGHSTGGESKQAIPFWYFPAGLVIGFVGALCGIGGGLFAGPLLHYTRGLALKRSAATALLLVFATTSAASVTEALQEDTLLSTRLVLPLMIGVLAGAQAGFKLSQRLSERGLKCVFCVVMLAAGLRILFSSGGFSPAPGTFASDHVTSLLSLAVGFGGGFVAPILGVGGGLMMVPGLFLCIDGLPFTAARATSLAGGTVASLRSLFLHSRAGNIVYGPGIVLGLGALVGATSGVFFTRSDGFVQAGRVFLGALLIFQALRFARELTRRREAP